MPNTITFSDSQLFYDELDSLINERLSFEIVFSARPPGPYADLWKRLSQCKGWDELIICDFMLNRPEFTPPFQNIQSMAEFAPLVTNFFHFTSYRSYRLSTQRYNIGILRRLALRPKT